MANIFKISVLLAIFMVIYMFVDVACKPIPKSDLIDGSDFLSLFIKQNGKTDDEEKFSNFNTQETKNRNDDDERESIISMETLQEDDLLLEHNSNYGFRTKEKFSTRKSLKTPQNVSSETHDSEHSIEKPESSIFTQNSKQIVKMVTSGSKIIFLQELSALPTQRNANKSMIEIGIKKAENLENTDKKTHNTSLERVEVVAVSVSSSVEKNHQHVVTTEQAPTNLMSVTVVEPLDSNGDIIKDSPKKNIQKLDFTKQSEEPKSSQESLVSDSVDGESTNIHTIVAAPGDINQSQRTIPITTRMERKQTKLVPFQTIIYHDTNYRKDGVSQPRSISYTSIAQTVDQLKPWKEIDDLLEMKRNESSKMHAAEEKIYSTLEKNFSEPSKIYSEPAKVYSHPSKFYSQPSKIYSEPARVYGQQEQQYGEPSKIYSEPSRIYSEPSKIYSQPSRVYGVPSKVYWPRPLHATPSHGDSQTLSKIVTTKNPNSRRVIFNLDKLPYDLLNAPQSNKSLLDPDIQIYTKSEEIRLNFSMPQYNLSSVVISNQRPTSYHLKNSNSASQNYASNTFNANMNTPITNNNVNMGLVTEAPNFAAAMITENSQNIYTPTPEQNFEVEESVSVMTNGRVHGIQQLGPQTTTASPTDDSKVGYVVEGRNFRKYRVEEKTSDGFIVGEYGVVSNNDGSLRGVRYTADSNINPSLIHQALMKFLSL